jgi:hypothetical protein
MIKCIIKDSYQSRELIVCYFKNIGEYTFKHAKKKICPDNISNGSLRKGLMSHDF